MPLDLALDPLLELAGTVESLAGAAQSAAGGLADGFDLVALRRSVSTLLLPPALPLLVALFGLLVLRRAPFAGRVLAWTGVLAAFFLSSSLGAALLARWAEGDTRPLGADELRSAMSARDPPQAIVILGGGARSADRERPDTSSVKPNTLERLVHGAWVARVTKLPVLVSGGSPSADMASEASLMKRTLEQSLGTPVRWAEDQSRDTAGNAQKSAEILHSAGIRRVILVTHAYHMPRARSSFERSGFTVLPAPHGFAGSPLEADLRDLLPVGDAALVAYRASHELVGRLWYALREQ